MLVGHSLVDLLVPLSGIEGVHTVFSDEESERERERVDRSKEGGDAVYMKNELQSDACSSLTAALVMLN